jgi:uridine kinase
LKPVMNGLWRAPMPALDRLDMGTRRAVDVLVRNVIAENTEIEMPQAVASLAVTLTADNHVYPCCHLTSDEWRIGSVGEIGSLQNSGRFQVTAAAYAKTPHACRVHDAWRAWQVACKSVWQTQGIATSWNEFGGQPLTRFADCVAASIVKHNLQTVAITGPSSVGKTTLAGDVARGLRARGLTCTGISTDDFLAHHLRGDSSYRRYSAALLKPQDYSFVDLCAVLRALQRGEPACWKGYKRGSGWGRRVEVAPASVYVLDGLFLDSTVASVCLNADLVVVLEAPLQAIAFWRRRRDDVLRRRLRGQFRTPGETDQEIASALRAYAKYEREPSHARRVKVILDSDHRVVKVDTAIV